MNELGLYPSVCKDIWEVRILMGFAQCTVYYAMHMEWSTSGTGNKPFFPARTCVTYALHRSNLTSLPN
jgi:hypothetical protein